MHFQFKGLFSDIPVPDDSDHFYLRWLRARKFNVKKAEEMLRKVPTHQQRMHEGIIERCAIGVSGSQSVLLHVAWMSDFVPVGMDDNCFLVDSSPHYQISVQWNAS